MLSEEQHGNSNESGNEFDEVVAMEWFEAAASGPLEAMYRWALDYDARSDDREAKPFRESSDLRSPAGNMAEALQSYQMVAKAGSTDAHGSDCVWLAYERSELSKHQLKLNFESFSPIPIEGDGKYNFARCYRKGVGAG